MTSTKTNSSFEDLEAIEAEVSSLEERLEAAHAKKANAEKELEELAPKRREISMAATVGEDPAAEAELKEIVQRRVELEIQAEAADDATKQLEELLEEARTRRGEAEQVVHRKEYERLLAEQRKLEQEVEECLDQYFELHTKLSELRSRVFTEGRAAGLNYLTPEITHVSDRFLARSREWESQDISRSAQSR